MRNRMLFGDIGWPNSDKELYDIIEELISCDRRVLIMDVESIPAVAS